MPNAAIKYLTQPAEPRDLLVPGEGVHDMPLQFERRHRQ
jgi:hypothetical protein